MRGTILGVPMIRIIVYWGLYRGPIVYGNYHMFLLIKMPLDGFESRNKGSSFWFAYVFHKISPGMPVLLKKRPPF